jgi:hypothetical protein
MYIPNWLNITLSSWPLASHSGWMILWPPLIGPRCMNLSLSHARAAGSRRGLLPPALSLAVARPTRSAGPVGQACKLNLNMHFYIGPTWLLVPVPGRRPDRLSACRLVTRAVSPAGACCLLNRRCGPFRVTNPTAPGIGAGAPRRTPTRLGRRARARLRQGEDQVQPSSPGRCLSPGQ